ncbi:MAG: hypothetical protein ABIS26_02440 [Candidatus Paceibacterota bacterium]
MKNGINNNMQNRQGGFIEIIVMLIIIFLIMRYFGLTFTGIIAWIENLFHSVL